MLVHFPPPHVGGYGRCLWAEEQAIGAQEPILRVARTNPSNADAGYTPALLWHHVFDRRSRNCWSPPNSRCSQLFFVPNLSMP